jgi:hypothetical protein
MANPCLRMKQTDQFQELLEQRQKDIQILSRVLNVRNFVGPSSSELQCFH